MTQPESQIIDALRQIEDEAPSAGLCPTTFRLIRMQMEQTIAERDELLKYRVAAKVKPYTGYAGQCPTCGAVFLDASTRYCGNCGQRIDFGRDTEKGGA